jgi:hypothetical protein
VNSVLKVLRGDKKTMNKTINTTFIMVHYGMVHYGIAKKTQNLRRIRQGYSAPCKNINISRKFEMNFARCEIVGR